MAAIDLNTLLELVGNLNDSNDPGSASERFRKYLRANVINSADVRQYIEVALQHTGEQYNKALQDLINHLGYLLGFQVTYGRYRGVKGQVGFDGFWESPSGWYIVVETKTTDVYAVRTDTLLGYMNSLISDGRISDVEKAIGLYVYGRFDRHTSQLENAIAIENRRNQLRVVSVPALLNLLELKQEYRLTHDSVLGLLQPAPIRIDPIVDLMRNVVAQEQERDGFITSTVTAPDGSPSQDEIKEPLTSAAGGEASRGGDGVFTGRRITSVIFRGERFPVSKWRQAFEVVVNELVTADKKSFEQVAPSLLGKKRPYLSSDPDALRKPAKISGTTLYYETNLSA